MAYQFVEKETHEQQEMAYILYMIIGSYFHSCTCKSIQYEKTLFLYYKEMGFGKQERMESEIIKKTESLLSDIKETFACMKAEVDIKCSNEILVLTFYTGFENVVATVDKKGKYDILLLHSSSIGKSHVNGKG